MIVSNTAVVQSTCHCFIHSFQFAMAKQAGKAPQETLAAKEEYKYVRKQDLAKKSQIRIKAMLGEELKGKSLLDKESQMETIWNEYLSLELKACLKGEEAGVYDPKVLNDFKIWLDEMLTTGKTKGILFKVWREGRTFLDFERTVLEQWQKVINEEVDKLREHNSNTQNFRVTEMGIFRAEDNAVIDIKHFSRKLDEMQAFLLKRMQENHDSLVQMLTPSLTVAEQQAQLKINIAQNREIKKVMNGMKKTLLVGHTCTFEETEYVVEDVLEGTDYRTESVMKNFQIAPAESCSINPPLSEETNAMMSPQKRRKLEQSDGSENCH